MRTIKSLSAAAASILLAALTCTNDTAGPTDSADAEAVAADKSALFIVYAPGDSATWVTRNVGLPENGAQGSTISWASNNTHRISTNGVVTRPFGDSNDVTVTLTATISKGRASAIKVFNLRVRCTGSTGQVTDIDGNVYTPVTIGSQVWTVENLRTTKLNDGTPISHVTDPTAWGNLTAPGYCYYDNSTNADTTGRMGALYNWYAVNTGRLAPAGWHVPDTTEWNTLVNYLIANGYNWDGSASEDKTAKSLAAQTDWAPYTVAGAIGNNLTVNNGSGFTALPGGSRYFSGFFYDLGFFGLWWSATQFDASTACYRYLDYRHGFLHSSRDRKSCGLSVRLLKDLARPAESGAVNLTSPDCGETFAVGGNVQITWTESGVTNVDRFVLSFSRDNAATWTEIGRVNPGVRSFPWSPTAANVGDLCLIRVASTGGTVADQSGLVFSVVPASTRFLASCSTSTTPISLLYPAPGDTFKVGDVVQFKYAVSAGFSYTQVVARVSLSGDSNPPVNITVAPIALPARTFLWTVPQTILSDSTAIGLVGEVLFQVGDSGGHEESPPMQIPVTIRQKGYAGTVTDVDGNVYTAVRIGSQVWSVENLRTTKLNDGTPISLVTDASAWGALTAPGYSHYGATTNADTISEVGALYNWYAVNTGKLAPAGWHIPDTTEWNALTTYLIANGYNWDGTTSGDRTAKSLAAQTGWTASSTAGAIGNDVTTNNSSGFTALPGGFRDSAGLFSGIGGSGLWWSAAEFDSSDACQRDLDYGRDFLNASHARKSSGLSVRLLRDEPASGEFGTVTVTAPDCGETFAAGESLQIVWSESGITNVSQFVLSFSNDNAATWTEIGRVNPGVRSFSWSPTAANVGDLCLVQVASTGGSVVDQSDLVFSVVPANTRFLASCSTSTAPISLLYPSEGDTFKVGDVVQIKFALSPDFQYTQVVAKVSADGGLYPFVNINTAPILLPARTFLWTVPEIIESGTMAVSLVGEALFQVGDYSGAQMSPAMQIPVTIEPGPPTGMKLIAGGTFQMGSDSVTSAEQPVHSVTVASFWIDSTEVTQADLAALSGINRADLTDDPNRPAEMVTWFDAVLYCNDRSKRDRRDTVYSYTSVSGTARDGRTGLGGLTINYAANGYRLPTEAEWEYACRAGTTTNYYWGSDSAAGYAWYQSNTSSMTEPVATKLPNAWGLYDMSGNVWEWCNDWTGAYEATAQTDPQGASTGAYRVIRGGGWDRDASYLRSARRDSKNPAYLGNDVGFRVCLPAR